MSEPLTIADIPAREVCAAHEATDVMGTPRFGPTKREEASIAFRPSLRAVKPIAAGEPLTTDNVRSVRPAGGLPPSELGDVLGAVPQKDLHPGDPITWNVVHHHRSEP